MMKKKESDPKKLVSLALQGGGAYGAFTWGVLDRLLEDGRLEVDGATGTSAGGINALSLAQGYILGGRKGAREHLHLTWKTISEESQKTFITPTLADTIFPGHGLNFSPMFHFFTAITKNFSPYQWNPFNINMLRDIIRKIFDFEALREKSPIQVFLSATNVTNARVKIFTGKELSEDAFLASACLPTLFQTVEIDGNYYWDGGFSGNPNIFPLINSCTATDIILILLTPQCRDKLPMTLSEIHWRRMELSLLNSLIRELRAITFITDLIDKGIADGTKIKRYHIHIIEAPEVFLKLEPSSSMNTDWSFLTWLFEQGRETAEAWLTQNFEAIGISSTVDLHEKFVG